ncbi:hypothetical protein F8388_011477 [Cannabis sativa]|uniref:DUF4283 domain-containing protein n=1 Tax=Cannabis sativa TaxID=3483 RepID=A0A7J6G413_CANSA|nr:hypothetical protein G4B88_007827 [Cannabis sativa]KAF4377724.1 hypothetical protein F8388_011477 [Cannabis sativa]
MDQIEELLSRTSQLKVTDEEGWEINEEREEDIGKSCLIGRLCTKKPFSRSLLKNILCRLWNLGDTEWNLKIKKTTATTIFLVLSYNSNSTLERILGKTPWVLNAGFLILERMKGIPEDWEATLYSYTTTGRVLNLPIKAITKSNMARLVGMAGEILDIQGAELSFLFSISVQDLLIADCAPVKFTINVGYSSGEKVSPDIESLTYKENGTYDDDFVRDVINEEDTEIILKILSESWDLEHKIRWHYSKHKEYSIKRLPSKSWIPTNHALSKRGVVVKPYYGHCYGDHQEKVYRALWECQANIEVEANHDKDKVYLKGKDKIVPPFSFWRGRCCNQDVVPQACISWPMFN